METHGSFDKPDFIGDCGRDGVGGGNPILAEDPGTNFISGGQSFRKTAG